MNVAIFYTGLPRFREDTQSNHKKLFDKLKTEFELVIYDFTTDKPRLDCPIDPNDLENRGNLQLWDFINGLDKIEENYVIRLRTDVILTNSSIDVIIKELKKIINAQTEISFLGISVKRFFDTPVVLEKVINRVLDFVIIADKNNLTNLKTIKTDLYKEKIKQGHVAFQKLIKNTEKSFNVHCRIFLLRKKYLDNDNWEYSAFKDYLMARPHKKSKNSLDWLNSTSGYFEDL